MSLSPRSTAFPADVALATFAEVLHHAVGDGGPLIGLLEPGAEAATIATWPVPHDIDHPADVLVGFRAAPPSHAIGLATPGRSRTLDVAGHGPVEVRITYLVDRTGAVVSLLDDGEGAPLLADAPPLGWVPDALARALGLATPAPENGPAACVEAVWIDRIAGLVLARPGQVRAWEPLALLHPLAGGDVALPGPLLALRCEHLEETSSWANVRQAWTGREERRRPRPPGGVVVEPAHWFDDGSFSRWAQRHLVPAEVLLAPVLDALPGDLGRQLVEALVTVRGPSEAPTSTDPPPRR